jgi:hypothetical protein
MDTEELRHMLKDLATNQQYILRQIDKIAEHINIDGIRGSDRFNMEKMEANLTEHLSRLGD